MAYINLPEFEDMNLEIQERVTMNHLEPFFIKKTTSPIGLPVRCKILNGLHCLNCDSKFIFETFII